MNKRGNLKSLIASHPSNLNAAKQGVHSPRLIQARAAEIASELTRSFEFSPAERLAVQEAARCIAILEAIDRDLDQRGLVDKDSPAVMNCATPEEVARGDVAEKYVRVIGVVIRGDTAIVAQLMNDGPPFEVETAYCFRDPDDGLLGRAATGQLGFFQQEKVWAPSLRGARHPKALSPRGLFFETAKTSFRSPMAACSLCSTLSASKMSTRRRSMHPRSQRGSRPTVTAQAVELLI